MTCQSLADGACWGCRPGWSEGPTGRQLTADLKNRRAVATFADLGVLSLHFFTQLNASQPDIR